VKYYISSIDDAFHSVSGLRIFILKDLKLSNVYLNAVGILTGFGALVETRELPFGSCLGYKFDRQGVHLQSAIVRLNELGFTRVYKIEDLGEVDFRGKMAEVKRIRKLLGTREHEVAEELLELHPEWNVDIIADIYLGDFWKCAGSPTGHCVYNKYNDPPMDRCLICGDPLERK
jgi:hypothetical protein